MKKACVPLTVIESRNVRNLLDGYVVLAFFLALILTVIFLLVLIRYITRHLANDREKEVSHTVPVLKSPYISDENEAESDDESEYGFNFDSDVTDDVDTNNEILVKNKSFASEVSLQSEVPTANVIFKKKEEHETLPPAILFDNKLLLSIYANRNGGYDHGHGHDLAVSMLGYVSDINSMRYYMYELMFNFFSFMERKENSMAENFKQFEMFREEAELKSFSEYQLAFSSIIAHLKRDVTSENSQSNFFASISSCQLILTKGVSESIKTFLTKEVQLQLSIMHAYFFIRKNIQNYHRHVSLLMTNIRNISNRSETIVQKHCKHISALLQKVSDLLHEEYEHIHAGIRDELTKLQTIHDKERQKFVREMCMNSIEQTSYQDFLTELLWKQQEERFETMQGGFRFKQFTVTFEKIWETFLQTANELENEMITELKSLGEIEHNYKCSKINMDNNQDQSIASIYQNKIKRDQKLIKSFVEFIIRRISSEFRLYRDFSRDILDAIPGFSTKLIETITSSINDKLAFIVLDTLIAILADIAFSSEKNKIDRNILKELSELINCFQTRNFQVNDSRESEQNFLHEYFDVNSACVKYIELIEKIFENNLTTLMSQELNNFLLNQYELDSSCYHGIRDTVANIDNITKEQHNEIYNQYQFFQRMYESKVDELKEKSKVTHSLSKRVKVSEISGQQNTIFDEYFNRVRLLTDFYNCHNTCLFTRLKKKLEISDQKETYEHTKPKRNESNRKKMRKSRKISTPR